MALPVFKTYENIVESLSSTVYSGSQLRDEREISVTKRILMAIGAVLADAWVDLKTAYENNHPALTQSDEVFDAHAAMTGFVRNVGQVSSGSAYAKNTTVSPVTIPLGLVLTGSPLGFRFVTTQSVTVPAGGYAFVAIRAQEVGAAKNLPANTVLTALLEQLPGVTFKVGSSVVTGDIVEGDLSGGTDRESLQAAQARYPAHLRSLRGSIYEAVRQALVSVPGVNNLVLLNAYPGPGYLTAMVEPDQGNAISQALYEAITSKTLAHASAGIAILVEPLQRTLINVNADVLLSDATVAPATAISAAQAAVNALTSVGTPSRSVYRSQIIKAIMDAVPATNVDLASPLTDQIAADGEVLAIGSVVITVRYS